MRVFIATLGTETNTFASIPTGIEDLRRVLQVDEGIVRTQAVDTAIARC